MSNTGSFDGSSLIITRTTFTTLFTVGQDWLSSLLSQSSKVKESKGSCRYGLWEALAKT